MATQRQRSEFTRSQLLKAFRSAFLSRGFDATTTQYVLTQIGLSKGAMYHHFRSKTEIVEALYEEESRGAIERAMRSVRQTASPLEQLKQACLAWTREVRVPEVSKILFEIGPSALGPQKAKSVEDEISLGYLEELLSQAIRIGEIDARDPRLLAKFLNALVAETALYELRTKKVSTGVLNDAIEGVFAALRP